MQKNLDIRKYIFHNQKKSQTSIEPFFKEKVGLVFCVDEIYIPYLSVALQSLNKNCKNGNYDIIIFETGLSEEQKCILAQKHSNDKTKIRFISLNEELKTISKEILYTRVYLTIAMYYRFFIPHILKTYDKVIYCDCDVLFFQELTPLYALDLKDNFLAAVKDTENLGQHFRNTDFVEYCKKTLKLQNSLNYFQSGVLIFNVKQCLKEHFLEQCINTLASLNKPIYPDQDVLNIVCENKVSFIEQLYNVENHIVVFHRDGLHYLSDEDLEAYIKSIENVVILHYSGDRKPWNSPQSANAKIWWYYARKTLFYEELLLANFKQSKPIYGACERVKNFLSYRLGKALVESKNPFLFIILPLRLLFIVYSFKKEEKMYKKLAVFNPNFQKLPLEQYADYEEALKIKEHLSYKLGTLMLKNPFTFIFNVFNVYRDFKKERECQKN